MFGLRNEDVNIINSILLKHPAVDAAVIFGSRAKGNFKNGSDVDIALKGADISYNTVLQISSELNEETLMPYHFDVLNYYTLKSRELTEHINRAGVEFYHK